jgi:proteasome beta subunit
MDNNLVGNLETEIVGLLKMRSLPIHVEGAKKLKSSGTTVFAMRYKYGVVVAGDRRTSYGHYHYDDASKVEIAGNSTLFAAAGTVAYIQELLDTIKKLIRHFEKEIEKDVCVDGIANLTKLILRENYRELGYLSYLLGYVAIPIIAGYDHRLDMGRVYSYDEAGAITESDTYTAVGSGSVFAETILDNEWHVDMTELEAVELSIRALARASKDNHTSQPELSPSTIKCANAKGIQVLSGEKALKHAWKLKHSDLKRFGKNEEHKFFSGKGETQ